MRAAVALRDVVGEAQHVLVIAVVPPQRDLDRDAVALGLEHDRLGDQRRLRAVEIAHERLDPAVVVQRRFLALDAARIDELDRHARIEKRELAQAMLQRREVELGLGEGRVDGRNVTSVPRLPVRVADDLQRRLGIAVAEAHVMLFAVAPDAQVEPFRQRVHDRNAHAVQTARHLVGVLVELTAGVQLGHDDLGRRDAFFRVDVGRDAAPVVVHRARSVGVQA